ncbi:MAG TPA: four helix bundle protein, partial [Thermoanaerobaculia bacterium]
MKTFEDLDVFQATLKLIDLVYEVTTAFPSTETYGLTSQMRRAAVSIA